MRINLIIMHRALAKATASVERQVAFIAQQQKYKSVMSKLKRKEPKQHSFQQLL